MVISVRKIGGNATQALHVRSAVLLCKRFGDFGKKERERAWRVTRKLGDLAERESAWRITGKHLKELERNGLDGRVLHRSILEK